MTLTELEARQLIVGYVKGLSDKPDFDIETLRTTVKRMMELLAYLESIYRAP